MRENLAGHRLGNGTLLLAAMVLPPVETTPLLLMRFAADAPQELIDAVRKRLERGGLIVVETETTPENQTILELTTTQAELVAEAENIRLMKRTNATNVVEYFTAETKGDFYKTDKGEWTEYDSEGLFNSSEQVMLVWSILDDIRVLGDGETEEESDLARELDKLNVEYVHRRRFFRMPGDRKAGETDLGNSAGASESLRHVLQASDLIDALTPVHMPRMRDKLLKETIRFRMIPPVESICDYYGEEVAYYFAWIDHMTRWLAVPGVLGLGTFILRKYRGDTIETCEVTPFYGLVTFIWAIVWLRSWERAEARYAYNWGTFSGTSYEKKYFNVRPEFEGELRVSPVTGLMEKYYSPVKRTFKYICSGFITAILLGVAFSVMILSLNLQGYIRPMNDPERWNDEHQHPFHYPFLSGLAEEGNLFDAASQWKCFIPVVLHAVCIMTMNINYRHVAEAMTNWENHETENSHANSLILKRFLFEAFDAYVALFYLAFYERDVDRLRAELVSLFYIDTFRRMLVEYVLPRVLHLMGRSKKSSQEVENAGRTTYKKSDEGDAKPHAPLTSECDRDEYEQFDDYLEMVIELGYVTLFASAYPLASLIAIAANLIEVRTDFFKLTKVCRRPRSIRTDGLGMWKMLMSSIIWLSALTNCLIFGFTSQQLMQFLPDFFYVDSNDHMRLVPGKGWIIVFIIFGLERVLLYSGLILNLIIPETPEDVVVELERRKYVRMEETRKLRVSMRAEKRNSR